MNVFDATKRYGRLERNENDYIGSDGLLVCGECHTRKQTRVNLFGREMVKPIMCKCRAERAEKERAAFEREQMAIRRRMLAERIPEKNRTCTFERDQSPQSPASTVCRRYVQSWPEMEREGMGILLFGDVGTGKTYYACCIANELLDQDVRVCVTNFPEIIARMQNLDNAADYLDELRDYRLLCIDDLGVERDTSYALERVYKVIDARYRSGRPTVITTNLSLKQMQEAPLDRNRIYDRIFEMCPIQLKMSGDSRRHEAQQIRRAMAQKLLREAQP